MSRAVVIVEHETISLCGSFPDVSLKFIGSFGGRQRLYYDSPQGKRIPATETDGEVGTSILNYILNLT